MTVKVRKQIYIEPDQEVRLKRLAAEMGVTEAELIRQAIDRHTHSLRPVRRDLHAWEEERAFIQHLIELGPIPGSRTWRREDAYEQ